MIHYSLGVILDNKEVEERLKAIPRGAFNDKKTKLMVVLNDLVKERMDVYNKIKNEKIKYTISFDYWYIPLKDGNTASYAKIKDILWKKECDQEKIDILKQEYNNLCNISPNYKDLLTIDRFIERSLCFETFDLLLKDDKLITPLIARQSNLNSKVLDEYTRIYRENMELQDGEDWFVILDCTI